MLPPTYSGRVTLDALFTGERSERGRQALRQWIAGVDAETNFWQPSLEGARIDVLLEENPSRKFVLHDWSRDPLFYDDSAALETIELARLASLRKFQRGDEEQLVMREFLIDSGLYSRFSESLGVRVEPLSP